MIEIILAGIAGAMTSATTGSQHDLLATFDHDEEGNKGVAFVSGGVSFGSVNAVSGRHFDGTPFGPGDLGSDVLVERAVALADSVPLHLSLPNALTFGETFIPGDAAELGLLSSVAIDAPGRWRFAGVDVIHGAGEPWAGTEVVLEALLGGDVVARSAFRVSPGDEFASGVEGRRLLLKAAAFDSLRLSAQRDGAYTALPVAVDNVFLVAPAPGSLALGACALLVAAPPRRRA